jgi:hypothetical protein
MNTEKHWHNQINDYVEAYGPVAGDSTVVQFHHPKGRKYKHNKVYIGIWWVLPIAYELHERQCDHPDNVTDYPKRFVQRFGTQGALFNLMCITMVNDGWTLPFGNDVMESILDTGY